MTSFIEARYWQGLENNTSKCYLCPRGCELKENQTGICSVRKNISGKIVTLVYGKIAASQIDPIEKKPLYHFYPGEKIFSIGTMGCNLICKFCQNWHLSRSRLDNNINEISPQKIIEQVQNLNLNLIAFTYNEPIVFAEYAIDISRLASEAGIKTASISSGYISSGKPVEDFFQYMNAANIDLKGFTDDFYVKNCGARLSNVLKTLKYIKQHTKVWLEITTLIIEGENDGEKELNEMIAWVLENLGPNVPWHFSAFHPAYQMKNHLATGSKKLLAIRDLALKKGISYVYTGNIHAPKGSNTYCHNCGELLIERSFYTVENHNIAGSKCKKCHTLIPGVF